MKEIETKYLNFDTKYEKTINVFLCYAFTYRKNDYYTSNKFINLALIQMRSQPRALYYF
jgi:hypothetical protein